MIIYTSYFAKLKELEKKGIIPISIARKKPHWFTGEELIKLAPPTWLMKYKEEEYTLNYKKYVLGKYNLQATVNYFKKKYKGKKIALICYEKSSGFCHRHLVAEWLEKGGLEVKEYGKIQTELYK